MSIESIKKQLAPLKNFFQKPQTKKVLIITGIALAAIAVVAGLVATATLVPGAAPIMGAVAIRLGIGIGVGIVVGTIVGIMKACLAR